MFCFPLSATMAEKQLCELAGLLGHEWEKLGTYLGFKPSDLQRLKLDHPESVQHQALHMLVMWKQRSTETAMFKGLCDALHECHRNDLVDKVQGWKENTHKSRAQEEETHPKPTASGVTTGQY